MILKGKVMQYCKSILRVKTNKSNDEIILLVQPLIDDANMKEYSLQFIRDKDSDDGYTICEVIVAVEGITKEYCKGVANEAKKYIEDVFGKKNVVRVIYIY